MQAKERRIISSADIKRAEELLDRGRLIAGFAADGTPQYREPDRAPVRRRRRCSAFGRPTGRECAQVVLLGLAIWLGYVALIAAADVARYGALAVGGG